MLTLRMATYPTVKKSIREGLNVYNANTAIFTTSESTHIYRALLVASCINTKKKWPRLSKAWECAN